MKLFSLLLLSLYFFQIGSWNKSSFAPFSISVALGDPKPKYGPKDSPRATPLAESSEFFRDPNHSAPGFWSLISYYIQQYRKNSCSSATLTMVLNAARSRFPRTADEPIISEKAFVEKIPIQTLRSRLDGSIKGLGRGINLDEAGKMAKETLKAFGFQIASVKVVHVTKATRTTVLKDLRSLSDQIFMAANFNQKNFTDDADVGHFAAVGAYDEKRGRVLILDPDREYYEPYWVSVDTFIEGLASLDSSAGLTRGYLLIEPGAYLAQPPQKGQQSEEGLPTSQ